MRVRNLARRGAGAAGLMRRRRGVGASDRVVAAHAVLGGNAGGGRCCLGGGGGRGRCIATTCRRRQGGGGGSEVVILCPYAGANKHPHTVRSERQARKKDFHAKLSCASHAVHLHWPDTWSRWSSPRHSKWAARMGCSRWHLPASERDQLCRRRTGLARSRPRGSMRRPGSRCTHCDCAGQADHQMYRPNTAWAMPSRRGRSRRANRLGSRGRRARSEMFH